MVKSYRSICPPAGAHSISRTKPSLISLALALLRVAPFTVFGAAKQRSSRCAAALIITSYASVSLTLVIQPLLSSRRPDYLGPHQNEPRIANHPSHPF
jgi:hypothetical protein